MKLLTLLIIIIFLISSVYSENSTTNRWKTLKRTGLALIISGSVLSFAIGTPLIILEALFITSLFGTGWGGVAAAILSIPLLIVGIAAAANGCLLWLTGIPLTIVGQIKLKKNSNTNLQQKNRESYSLLPDTDHIRDLSGMKYNFSF